jgi:hypothetical protein
MIKRKNQKTLSKVPTFFAYKKASSVTLGKNGYGTESEYKRRLNS